MQNRMKTAYPLFFLVLIILLQACNNSQDKKDPIEDADKNTYWGHRYNLSTDIQYGEDPEMRLDIYSQGQYIGEPDYWVADSLKHPTVIYFHGGGWTGGKKENRTPFLIPYLEKGWNVVNVEYRRGENTAPQAVNDVMCAISWVANNSEPYNIDLDNIIITGQSAGGHLALITGLLNTKDKDYPCYAGDKIKISAIVNWFGITDIAKVEEYLRTYKPEWNYAGKWISDEQNLDSISNLASPVRHITKNSPPIITIHGKMDSVVPYEQAIILHDLLEEKGVENELVTDPEGKHLGFKETKFQEIWEKIFSFLDERVTQ